GPTPVPNGRGRIAPKTPKKPPGKVSNYAAILVLALAGCTTLSNTPASDANVPLDATSKSNLTSLGEVIDKHPDDPQAYNMRGSVYGEAGRNDQALADFNKAIGLDPNYAQAYANRALIYRKTNKLDLAL